MIIALWPAAWGGLTGISVVDGTSMESVYNNDDVVLTLRQSSYRAGDIVSYKVPDGQHGAGEQVIHRIVAVENSAEEPRFITQGDNNPSVDPWVIDTPDVEGKAVLHLPRIGAAFRGANGPLLGTLSGLVIIGGLRSYRSRTAKREQVRSVAPPTIGHLSGL